MAENSESQAEEVEAVEGRIESRVNRLKILESLFLWSAVGFFVLGYVIQPVAEPVQMNGQPVVVDGEPLMMIPVGAARKGSRCNLIGTLLLVTSVVMGMISRRGIRSELVEAEREARRRRHRLIHGD